jgi:hypothetical protein
MNIRFTTDYSVGYAHNLTSHVNDDTDHETLNDVYGNIVLRYAPCVGWTLEDGVTPVKVWFL